MMGEKFPIQCVCKRGYMTSLFIDEEAGIPIAFALYNGFLVMEGWCDECSQLIMFSVSLADLAIERPPWTSSKIRRV